MVYTCSSALGFSSIHTQKKNVDREEDRDTETEADTGDRYKQHTVLKCNGSCPWCTDAIAFSIPLMWAPFLEKSLAPVPLATFTPSIMVAGGCRWEQRQRGAFYPSIKGHLNR